MRSYREQDGHCESAATKQSPIHRCGRASLRRSAPRNDRRDVRNDKHGVIHANGRRAVLRRQPHRCAARLVGRDPLFHQRPEMPDQALDRPGRGIAQSADRVAFDLPRHLVQRVDLGRFGAALDHAVHHPPHPAGAFAARRALAAAFVHVELRQPRDRLDDVGGFVHHDHRRGAQAAVHVAQAVEIHQHVVADRSSGSPAPRRRPESPPADCPSRRARRRRICRSVRATGCRVLPRRCTACSHGRRCRTPSGRCCSAGQAR